MSQSKSPPSAGEIKASPPRSAKLLVVVGVLGTLAYIYALWRYCSTHPMGELTPPELGTFVGGAISPLAIGWLVLGFFQQGIELRHSARALWLQSEELRNSVEQQKALVDVTREQFEHERAERVKADLEADRLAQPKIGVQANGYVSSGGTRTFDFTLANAGAIVTSVRLLEGETSHGQAASWRTGDGLSVNFRFEAGEELRPRKLTLTFNDARGRPSKIDLDFPVVETNGQQLLGAPEIT